MAAHPAIARGAVYARRKAARFAGGRLRRAVLRRLMVRAVHAARGEGIRCMVRTADGAIFIVYGKIHAVRRRFQVARIRRGAPRVAVRRNRFCFRFVAERAGIGLHARRGAGGRRGDLSRVPGVLCEFQNNGNVSGGDVARQRAAVHADIMVISSRFDILDLIRRVIRMLRIIIGNVIPLLGTADVNVRRTCG